MDSFTKRNWIHRPCQRSWRLSCRLVCRRHCLLVFQRRLVVRNCQSTWKRRRQSKIRSWPFLLTKCRSRFSRLTSLWFRRHRALVTKFHHCLDSRKRRELRLIGRWRIILQTWIIILDRKTKFVHRCALEIPWSKIWTSSEKAACLWDEGYRKCWGYRIRHCKIAIKKRWQTFARGTSIFSVKSRALWISDSTSAAAMKTIVMMIAARAVMLVVIENTF